MPYTMHDQERVSHGWTRSEVVERLRQCLPEDRLVTSDAELEVFDRDALTMYRQTPFIVVLPRTVEEVVSVMATAEKMGVPIVPRGAGTGLSGGALPVASAIVLSLSGLNRIVEIDAENRLARLQPGVTNRSVSEAAQIHGLFYAPDPSSQIACTIGGNVAENSGGMHCLKYGLTVHNVLAVELVTSGGGRVTLGSEALDGAGLDLLGTVCGSEGLLGVVVEVTVRLLPLPLCSKTILAVFRDVESAAEAVAGIMASGLIPAALEFMDRMIVGAAEAFVSAGYPLEAAALLLIELDGLAEAVEADHERLVSLLNGAGAFEVRLAGSEIEKQRFWSGRKSAFPAVGRISPDYYCMDGTIPRSRLAEVLAASERLAIAHGLKVANVFHAGDGNLHPLILYDGAIPGELERAEALGARILELCVDVGGTITGEHGVGAEKINQMCYQFSAAEIRQFSDLKSAFDPKRLLNPGKAIPSLHRCSELGRMHVHQGRLPYPGLERF